MRCLTVRACWDGETVDRGGAEGLRLEMNLLGARNGKPADWLALNAAVNSTAILEEKDGKQLVIGNNTVYSNPGSDVLGIMGTGNVEIGNWAPYDMTLQAAIFSLNGKVSTYDTNPTHGTLTFTGSIAAANSTGGMNMFATNRTYNPDPTLKFVPPPWFPRIPNAWGMSLFREITPAY